MKGRGAAVSVEFRPESAYKLNKSQRARHRCLSACVNYNDILMASAAAAHDAQRPTSRRVSRTEAPFHSNVLLVAASPS